MRPQSARAQAYAALALDDAQEVERALGRGASREEGTSSGADRRRASEATAAARRDCRTLDAQVAALLAQLAVAAPSPAPEAQALLAAIGAAGAALGRAWRHTCASLCLHTGPNIFDHAQACLECVCVCLSGAENRCFPG